MNQSRLQVVTQNQWVSNATRSIPSESGRDAMTAATLLRLAQAHVLIMGELIIGFVNNAG